MNLHKPIKYKSPEAALPLCFGALCFILFQLERTGVEPVVLPLFGDELFMASALDNASLFQNHYHVGVLYRGKPVCDNKNSPALHESVHAALDYRLGVSVYG